MTQDNVAGSIIRIDKPNKNGRGGTHGWQVRLSLGQHHKYYSKMFSDGKLGGREEALKAAEAYRAQLPELFPQFFQRRWPNPVPPYQKTLGKNNTSGRIGVYRTHSYHKSGLKQEFWGAHCSVGPYNGRPAAKRFYISTYGEEEAKRLAIEFRELWEEAVWQGLDAVRDLFEEYRQTPDSLPFFDLPGED